MTNPRLSFGEIITTGELARGVHPADELGLQMALALGQADPPSPPFAYLPVYLDGQPFGQFQRIQFVWGGTVYQFISMDGRVLRSSPTKEGVLEQLDEMLQLASHQP